MKKLVEYLVASIVNHPKSVKVEEKIEGELISIKVSVHPEDIGQVVGKGGKIIKAIRRLAYISAVKRKKRLSLELIEDQKSKKGSSRPVGTVGNSETPAS